ncbi:hypothetical protein PtB15_5B161 [Puccinia triticina]|nr:hypothetical protein PtB15_5B161 [Puccinia triticina]
MNPARHNWHAHSLRAGFFFCSAGMTPPDRLEDTHIQGWTGPPSDEGLGAAATRAEDHFFATTGPSWSLQARNFRQGRPAEQPMVSVAHARWLPSSPSLSSGSRDIINQNPTTPSIFTRSLSPNIYIPSTTPPAAPFSQSHGHSVSPGSAELGNP